MGGEGTDLCYQHSALNSSEGAQDTNVVNKIIYIMSGKYMSTHVSYASVMTDTEFGLNMEYIIVSWLVRANLLGI